MPRELSEITIKVERLQALLWNKNAICYGTMSIYCMWIKHIAQREHSRHLQVSYATEASDERDNCK